MEGVRVIAHTIAQLNSTKRIPNPERWMPLITDEGKTKIGEPDEKELQAIKDRIAAAKKRGELLRVKQA